MTPAGFCALLLSSLGMALLYAVLITLTRFLGLEASPFRAGRKALLWRGTGGDATVLLLPEPKGTHAVKQLRGTKGRATTRLGQPSRAAVRRPYAGLGNRHLQASPFRAEKLTLWAF